ncbi:hypothetical protein [Burkholderia ubonensis]|uniref:hypothetical protein n=1 Tax=Burkholderia ubonensis TaxID=101571 RepID=UPI00075F365D|nr:hypothetical protein [Burkholderia ubonensis]KVS41114.1 hypothetical protein WK38_31655 [Burkholderia ubonensis]KVS45870.1 hypothetical protein WK37_12800 [Burkholderia ubonensis]KVS79744.1 hypothetical protein WK42_14505 [Burkholderia ubonensis]KVS87405.1 hypothetical protein WK44_00140 [Burkholderia ubonensis]KVS94656.1 hypothetical protein WK43_09380 [Burkholderia ubonensis]
MPALTLADTLRLAIIVLRDSVESRRMPSDVPLDDASVALHADAADLLARGLDALRDHELPLTHDRRHGERLMQRKTTRQAFHFAGCSLGLSVALFAFGLAWCGGEPLLPFEVSANGDHRYC